MRIHWILTITKQWKMTQNRHFCYYGWCICNVSWRLLFYCIIQ